MTLEEQVAKAMLKVEFYDCESDMYGNSLDVFFAEIDEEHLERARNMTRAAIAIIRPAVLEEAAREEPMGDGHLCGHAEMGTYAGQVTLVAPSRLPEQGGE